MHEPNEKVFKDISYWQNNLSHEASLPIEDVVLLPVTADWPKFAVVVALVVIVVAVVSK